MWIPALQEEESQQIWYQDKQANSVNFSSTAFEICFEGYYL